MISQAAVQVSLTVARAAPLLSGHARREGGFAGALQGIFSLEATGDKKCQAAVEEFLLEVSGVAKQYSSGRRLKE